MGLKLISVCFVILIGFEYSLSLSNGQETFRVAMPDVIPVEDDNYLCTAFKLEELVSTQGGPIYINKFEADSDANKAHHIIVQSCRVPGDQALNGKPWDCRHHQTCEEGEEILYAWARRAPPTILPDDVTFKVDPRQTPYLVLQVHYAHKLDERDSSAVKIQFQRNPSRYTAGIYLMMRTRLTIPGRNAVTHGDMNCIVRSEIHPFAFRTHAHKWGSVITGYKYDSQTAEMVEFARGNPQWPQSFYPVTKNLTLMPGDFFVGRCTYNTTENPQTTYIGSTSNDEMCNLYIMYYGQDARFEQCFDEQSSAISNKMPLDSDMPPPRNEQLENVAVGRTKGDLDYEPNDEAGSRRKGQLKLQDPVESMEEIRIGMPGVRPPNDDSYLCTSFQVWNLTNNREMYIRGFQAEATALKAHHIILQRCDNPPYQPGQTWNCIHHATCNGQSKILFAWAKNAKETTLPDEVGFRIGSSSHEHLILQVHYLHPLNEPDFTALNLKITDEKPKYSAGIFLLWSGYANIPPKQPKVHADINCLVKDLSSPIYTFAFRTHAHALSTLITGYKFRNNQPTELARGDPQKPQTFYMMSEVQEVQNGDYLAARCTYNSTMKNSPTKIGATSGDEMCNLYIMYYTESDNEDYKTCSGIQDDSLVSSLPASSDEKGVDLSNIEVPISYEFSNNQIMKDENQHGGDIPGDFRNGKSISDAGLFTVPNWPPEDTLKLIGQPTGITLDIYDNPVIFHRGDRVWDGSTFKSNDVYAGDMKKPIQMNTIITLDKDTGKVLNAWGANMFFLPHMITIDSENKVWLTDVAMHQVFQFPPYGGSSGQLKLPKIVLGTPFEPGNDDTHYCKPTSVAVMKDARTFFVADGYCNSRIIQYVYDVTPDGHHNVTKITSWGVANVGGLPFTKSPYSFNIPHGLALAENRNLICVADRENGRVQCFNTNGGQFEKSIQPQEFGSTIFSVAYASQSGNLYAVGGPENFGTLTGKRTQGYIINLESGKLVNTFNGANEGFNHPHDVAVNEDGSFVYVVEINPFRVWKLSAGEHGPGYKQPTSTQPSFLASIWGALGRRR